jgi:hypothetical protein
MQTNVICDYFRLTIYSFVLQLMKVNYFINIAIFMIIMQSIFTGKIIP